MTDNVFPFVPPASRDKPDADCHYTDEHGVSWSLFGVAFEFGGSRWTFQIWARDFDDAEARIAALKESAELGGQIYANVPADV